MKLDKMQGGAKMQAPQMTEQTIKDAKPVICTCGGMIFEEKLMFKKISAIMSPSGKDELFPINLVVCTKCGLVPEEFNPHKIIPEELVSIKKNRIIPKVPKNERSQLSDGVEFKIKL